MTLSFRKSLAGLSAMALLFHAGAILAEEGEDPTVIAVDVKGGATHIQEDVILTGSNENLIVLQVTSGAGEATEVTAEGRLSAELSADHGTQWGAFVLNLTSEGDGSSVSVNAKDGMIARTRWDHETESPNFDSGGAWLSVGERGYAALHVDGDVQALASTESKGQSYLWTAGISVSNGGGETDVTVNGNVIADGGDHGSSSGLNLHHEADSEDSPKAVTKIRVNGDVAGSNFGIRQENYIEGSSMDILVNGTISGSSEAITLDGITDNVLITAWKVMPDPDGNLLTYGPGDGAEPSRELEQKMLQYILRVDAQSAGRIIPEAETLEGLPVAREAEKVALKLDIPSGLVLRQVFSGPGRTLPLFPDADGNYFLTVPRGGGVELSMLLAPLPSVPDGLSKEKHILSAAEGSSDLDALKEQLPEGASPAAVVPDTMALSVGRKVQEARILQLDSSAGAMEQLSIYLIPGKKMDPGAEAAVLFALPAGDGIRWLEAAGTVQQSGLLKVSLNRDLLQALSGRVFLTVILI